MLGCPPARFVSLKTRDMRFAGFFFVLALAPRARKYPTPAADPHRALRV